MPIEYMNMEQELLEKYNIPKKWADCTEEDEKRYIQFVLPIILNSCGIMQKKSSNYFDFLTDENS